MRLAEEPPAARTESGDAAQPDRRDRRRVAIIGAGPAGLTAGYLLAKRGVPVTVFEADPRYVGGIARTVEHEGYRFDIGGHRFFSKSQAVNELWSELLPDGLLERPRLSRIYYRGRFFSYPLRALEALWKLGLAESSLCVLSYARSRLFPIREVRSFEDWVTNQFGRRLYRIFFKTYTEKVWGMSCREISADWAAQRIQGLSLMAAVRNAILPPRARRDGSGVIKTLIGSFRYPRLGPGMMWESCASRIRELGGEVLLASPVTECEHLGGEGGWIVRYGTAGEAAGEFTATDVISSAPIRDLALMLRPALPARVVEAAASLRYRDFLTVALIARESKPLADNWVYVHDPNVRVGRVQNFKSWSPDLVPAAGMCCLGLEYFCHEGDGMWSQSDGELVRLASREIEAIGLARAADVVDARVVRQAKAYPVYDDNYAERVGVIRAEIARGYPGLHLVGRNGMHKYNNQDHSMMTAMLTVENILAGRAVYDVWRVNQDAEYHEDGASGLRDVPQKAGKAW